MAWADVKSLPADAGFATFNESVTYTPPTPPGGAPLVVQGIFGQSEVLALDGTVSTIAPSVDLRAADISGGPLTGATVAIAGVSYEVFDVRGPDHVGVCTLLLVLSSIPS